MSTIFSQQISSGKLLPVVTSGQKSHLSDGFRLKTHNNIPSKICCKNVVDVALLILYYFDCCCCCCCYILFLLVVITIILWTHSCFISASNWGNHNGIECKGETKPIFAPAYPRHHPAEMVVEKVLRTMLKPVHLLNVTRLSQQRKDAHPSIYGLGGHYGMDCSHWCLAGVPDTWNQLLYAELISK